MKAFDPGWAHHETSNPLLSLLKGVYHLQWISLHLIQYFKSLDCVEDPIPCPNSLDIVNKIQIQEKWEPNLSSTFWTGMAFAPSSVSIWVPSRRMVRQPPTCRPSPVAPLLALALVVPPPLMVLMRPKPPTRDWTTPISTVHSLAPTSPPL
jgi:hypothetical protein